MPRYIVNMYVELDAEDAVEAIQKIHEDSVKIKNISVNEVPEDRHVLGRQMADMHAPERRL